MKKQNLLKILLIFTFYNSFLLYSNNQFECIKKIEPIVDLRAPRSLYEELHDGINSVCISLQHCSDDFLATLNNAKLNIELLSESYDKLINTTRNHQVHNDAKESLQKMIDKLTSLIDDIEGKTGDDSDQSTQDELKSLKSCCDDLKIKISN